VGEKEKLAALEAQHLAKPRDHFFRGMALAGFQVADIRSRSLNPSGDLFLGEIESAAALANDGAESWLSRFSHRMSFVAAGSGGGAPVNSIACGLFNCRTDCAPG